MQFWRRHIGCFFADNLKTLQSLVYILCCYRRTKLICELLYLPLSAENTQYAADPTVPFHPNTNLKFYLLKYR